MQILPSFGTIRFSCPLCGALAHQYWGKTHVEWLDKDVCPARFDVEAVEKLMKEQDDLPEEKRFQDWAKFPEYIEVVNGRVFQSDFKNAPYSSEVYNLDISKCDSCDEVAIWLQDRMVHPSVGPSAFANEDMPESVKKLFIEAGAVFSNSPRAAAALLRLALQVLLKELGESGRNINADINSLFKKGLSANLTKVMHSLRIIGNESVHPGVISVDDEPSIAEAMFHLINEVVEQLISRPKKQDELWKMLPEAKRKPIEDQLKRKE